MMHESSIILQKEKPRYYKARDDKDRNSILITILLLANDLGPYLYFYIEMLQKGETPYTERCSVKKNGNLIMLTDRFCEEDGVLIQLTLIRENLIHVLKKWDELAKQKVDEIVLTQHDDGTVTIDGR